MKPLHLLIAVLACSAMTSCAISRTYRWQEEVLLHDGRVIVVERSVRTGEVPVEMGQRPGESDYALTFRTPSGAAVTWESGKSFRPIILDFSGETPYVVATGRTGPDYEKHGCPKPPYFIFRWTAAAWQRIDYDQLPKEVRKRNLSSSVTSDEDASKALRRGRLTVEDVKQSHRWLRRHNLEVREDAPNPCANRLNSLEYVPPKQP